MEPGMADPGFPQSPTGGNTATASMPGIPGIRFDPIYFRSIPGILKCVQMVSTCFLLFHACIIKGWVISWEISEYAHEDDPMV